MPVLTLPDQDLVESVPGGYYRWPAKMASSQDTYTVDLTAWVQFVGGDTLVSVTAQVQPGGVDGGLVIAGQIGLNGNQAIIPLAKGLQSQDYALNIVARSIGGRTLSVLTMIYVLPSLVPDVNDSAVLPPGYPGTSGQTILSGVTATFPNSPYGLNIGDWWMNFGVPTQVTADTNTTTPPTP